MEMKIGNTTIRIHDDYCKDKKDVQRILDRIAANAIKPLQKH